MIYIQLIGLLAFCIVVLSFYKKNPVTILMYQVTSNFAYAVHYFLLGGISGAISNVIGMVRNITFIKVKNNRLFAVIIFILLYLITTIIFYENIYSIFPMCGNSAYLICMMIGDRKSLLIGGILSSSFWLLYAIFVLSYVGMITETILIVSNVIQLIRIKRNVKL